MAGRESLVALAREVADCRLCPRLTAWAATVCQTKRKAFADETYWGRPVPGWGDPQAQVLLVGLAPAAHGALRTGRMFTGDRSGDFLYAALHRAGMASQATAVRRGDGLKLRRVYITAAVRCAPPGNRPLPEEFARCRPYLVRELQLLPRLRTIITLGGLGHAQLLAAVGARPSAFPFAHGAEYTLGRWRLLACYHPSQQNTFTGRLTPAMLDAVLARAAAVADYRPK